MIRKWYPHVVSTIALVVALTMGGAYAANNLIGSKQIKNGSIKSVDLANNGIKSADIGRNQVRSADIAANQVGASEIAPNSVETEQVAPGAIGSTEIANGAVQSSDIGTGQIGSGEIANGAVSSADIGDGEVTPGELRLPEPLQILAPAGEFPAAYVNQDYRRLATIGRYTKQDATTDLQVTWTGTAQAGFAPCIFQLRVDGQPSAVSAGEIYVTNSSSPPVAATSMFRGLPAGDRAIEVWARSTHDGSGTEQGGFPCEIGPAETTIGQTFVIAEQVS